MTEETAEKLSKLEETLSLPAGMRWIRRYSATVKGLLAVGAALGGLTGLQYGLNAREDRPMQLNRTWTMLNSEPADCPVPQERCDAYDAYILEHDTEIADAAQKAGIEKRELVSLIAASQLNPHSDTMKTLGYRGSIYMLPSDAGLSGEILEQDARLNIEAAATRFARLKQTTSMPEKAVAMFFTYDADVEQAMEKHEKASYICNSIAAPYVEEGYCGREVVSASGEKTFDATGSEQNWVNNLWFDHAKEAVKIYFSHLD